MVGAGVQLVPAPGAGTWLACPATGHGVAVLSIDTSAGIYTNVNANANWNLYLSGTADAPLWAGANDVLTFGAANVQPLVPMMAGRGVTVPLTSLVGQITDDAPSDLSSGALFLSVDNRGTGTLTGGNAANVLTVSVYYYVLPIT